MLKIWGAVHLALEQFCDKLLENSGDPKFMPQVKEFMKAAQEGLDKALQKVDKLEGFAVDKSEGHFLAPTQTSSLSDYLDQRREGSSLTKRTTTSAKGDSR